MEEERRPAGAGMRPSSSGGGLAAMFTIAKLEPPYDRFDSTTYGDSLSNIHKYEQNYFNIMDHWSIDSKIDVPGPPRDTRGW